MYSKLNRILHYSYYACKLAFVYAVTTIYPAAFDTKSVNRNGYDIWYMAYLFYYIIMKDDDKASNITP